MALALKPLVELSTQHTLADYVTALAWSPVGNTLAIATVCVGLGVTTMAVMG